MNKQFRFKEYRAMNKELNDISHQISVAIAKEVDFGILEEICSLFNQRRKNFEGIKQGRV